RISNAPGYESSIGPLLLILGLLGMLPNNLDKKSRNLKESAIILGVGGLAAWAIAGSLSGHLIRTQLYYVLFPAFAILAAFGFVAVQNFDLPKLRISRVLEAVVVLALGLNLTQIGIDSINSGLLSFWSGGLSTQAYEEKNLGVYANATSSLSETGERVLFLWEPRSYACATDCDPDEIIDRWPHDLALYRSPAAVIDAWRAAGFSEVLYYRLGAKFIYDDPQHFHPYDFDSMDAALSSLPVIQDYNGVYILLSLSQ
ncbi:MAG TPA: hypothetical protein VLK33_10755, partial [Terriglobales bacterium]|nr:hypothetical protein [Terriglobales bacterium]